MLRDELKNQIRYYNVPYPRPGGQLLLSHAILYGACYYQRSYRRTLRWLSILTGLSTGRLGQLSDTLVEVGLLGNDYRHLIRDGFFLDSPKGMLCKWKYFTYYPPSEYSKEIAKKCNYEAVTFHALYSFCVCYNAAKRIDNRFISNLFNLDVRTVVKYLDLLEDRQFIELYRRDGRFAVGRYDPNLDYFQLQANKDDEEQVGGFDLGKPEELDEVEKEVEPIITGQQLEKGRKAELFDRRGDHLTMFPQLRRIPKEQREVFLMERLDLSEVEFNRDVLRWVEKCQNGSS